MQKSVMVTNTVKGMNPSFLLILRHWDVVCVKNENPIKEDAYVFTLTMSVLTFVVGF